MLPENIDTDRTIRSCILPPHERKKEKEEEEEEKEKERGKKRKSCWEESFGKVVRWYSKGIGKKSKLHNQPSEAKKKSR